MARGRKTGGRDWKKGESGNPDGKPTLPADIKSARELTQIEFERIVNKYFFLTVEELKEHVADPKTTIIELIVASIVKSAVEDADDRRLAFLLSRTIGVLPAKQINDAIINASNYSALTDADLISRSRRVRERLERILSKNE